MNLWKYSVLLAMTFVVQCANLIENTLCMVNAAITVLERTVQRNELADAKDTKKLSKVKASITVLERGDNFDMEGSVLDYVSEYSSDDDTPPEFSKQYFPTTPNANAGHNQDPTNDGSDLIVESFIRSSRFFPTRLDEDVISLDEEYNNDVAYITDSDFSGKIDRSSSGSSSSISSRSFRVSSSSSSSDENANANDAENDGDEVEFINATLNEEGDDINNTGSDQADEDNSENSMEESDSVDKVDIIVDDKSEYDDSSSYNGDEEVDFDKQKTLGVDGKKNGKNLN